MVRARERRWRRDFSPIGRRGKFQTQPGVDDRIDGGVGRKMPDFREYGNERNTEIYRLEEKDERSKRFTACSMIKCSRIHSQASGHTEEKKIKNTAVYQYPSSQETPCFGGGWRHGKKASPSPDWATGTRSEFGKIPLAPTGTHLIRCVSVCSSPFTLGHWLQVTAIGAVSSCLKACLVG